MTSMWKGTCAWNMGRPPRTNYREELRCDYCEKLIFHKGLCDACADEEECEREEQASDN